MIEYMISLENAFEPAVAAIKVVTDLISSLNRDTSSTQGEAERHIGVQLDEAARLLLQAYLDKRSSEEERVWVLGLDGVLRTQFRRSTRALESTFGTVHVERFTVYATDVSEGVRVLDYDLNLPARKYSYCVQEQAARLAAKMSFDSALEELSKATRAHVPKRQFELIVREAACDFEAFYALSTTAATSDPLVMTCDNKGVVMRPDSLTEHTRKAADRAEPKLTSRLSRGEKRGRKRMASIWAVYDQPAMPRTPGSLLDPEIDTRMPRPQNKRVFASIEETLRTAVSRMFDEAEQRDPRHEREWVVLVDGSRHQEKCIREEARRREVGVTLILDLVHVTEYLWKVTWRLHPEGSREGEQWVGDRLLRILQGKASTVAAGIRRSATRRGLTGESRKAADAAADYFLNHKTMMRYDDYLERGFSIATGVVEGACRYLVKDRMDITGACWGLASAEAVLKLRALVTNGDFDEYWRFHETMEQERNRTHALAVNDNVEASNLRAVG